VAESRRSETILSPEIGMEMDVPTSSPASGVVAVNRDLSIPITELQFRFSRSGGPGGQHVNRSETRVELLFDVQRSPSLTEEQRRRLIQRLGRHLDADGVMHMVGSETRSQVENRARVTNRFRALIAAALRRRKRRIPTTPSAASREQRIANKRARSNVKRARHPPSADEYN
jgi:ribosome-associated protein